MNEDNTITLGEPGAEDGPLLSVGPFNEYKVVLNGYRVPNLQGHQLPNGDWHFSLSNQCSIVIPELHAKGVAWMIANAMAIGAAYTCFGKGSRPLNPFSTRLIGLDMGTAEESECGVSNAEPPTDNIN